MKKDMEISEKLFSLLHPVIYNLNIKNTDEVKEMCDRIVKHPLMGKINTIDILKCEKFQILTDMSENIKSELIKLSEIEHVSLSRFNEVCSSLQKIVVTLNNFCISDKIQYSFNVDIDKNNEEYLSVYNTFNNSLVHLISGISLRQLVSDIILNLNNIVYHNPDKCVIINVNLYDANNAVLEMMLDLEAMVNILNVYTNAINIKYNKAINKQFIFKADSLDMAPKNNDYASSKFSNIVEKSISTTIYNDDIGFVKLRDIMSDKRDKDSH